MDPFDLTGRTAITTGAASGLGRAMALAMARRGAQSLLVDRDGPGLAAFAAELAAEGLTARIMAGDVTDLGFLEACLAQAPAADILLCAAGRSLRKTALETEPEDFDALMGTNLRALFFWNRAFAARLIARGAGGAIINIASQGGITPLAGRPIYCTSKAAVIHLTKSLAVDWATAGIRVNAICPGLMDTPFIAAMKAIPGAIETALAHIPAGRMGLPDDLAGPALLLASDAGRYITGHALVADGGWTLV